MKTLQGVGKTMTDLNRGAEEAVRIAMGTARNGRFHQVHFHAACEAAMNNIAPWAMDLDCDLVLNALAAASERLGHRW